MANADVNRSGTRETDDVLLILRYFARFITDF